MMTHAKLRELVQARLGDLDGHPEQVGALGLNADNLGRPWAPGKKHRGRSRATALATSSTGTGATVNCEGDAVGARVGTNANVIRRLRERTVGMHAEVVSRTSTQQLSKLIREAFAAGELKNVNMQALGDKVRDVRRYPGTAAEMFANALEGRWNREMGARAGAEGLEAVPGGVMLVPEQMPAEARIERWFSSTFDPYDVDASWDVVNTEQGPAIMFSISHQDMKRMQRNGF